MIDRFKDDHEGRAVSDSALFLWALGVWDVSVMRRAVRSMRRETMLSLMDRLDEARSLLYDSVRGEGDGSGDK